MNAPTLDRLQNLVIRPGIEEKLTPLLMYRGQQSLGRIQAMWNHALLMMEANACDLSAGIKLHQNPAYAQLCGPHRRLQMCTMYGAFSRFRLNPTVTDNIPGLTEFIADVLPRPYILTPVSLYGHRVRAPWRIELPSKPRKEKAEKRPRDAAPTGSLFYPYLIYEPNKENDLLFAVNNAVPKSVPEQLRADICQDLIVAVLSGEMDRSELEDQASVYIKKVMKMFPMKYGPLSLDAPMPGAEIGDRRTLGQMIDANAYHW